MGTEAENGPGQPEDPKDVPETPPDEPQPAPVQDPPAEPITVPYVVARADRGTVRGVTP